MEQNPQQELRSMKIVYIALVMGVAFFILITIYLNQSVGGFMGESEETEGFNNIYLLVANIMAIGSIMGGILIFSKRIKNIKKFQLSEKLKKYRELMIIRAATIEGAAFLFIVGFMLTGSNIFLFEAIAVLFLLVFFFPTNNRIVNEIKHDIREIN